MAFFSKTEARDFLLAPCEVGGGGGAVGDGVPSYHSYDNTGKSFEEKKETPRGYGAAFTDFDDCPCQRASKGGREWCC